MSKPCESSSMSLYRTEFFKGLDEVFRPSRLRWYLNVDATDTACSSKTVYPPFRALRESQNCFELDKASQNGDVLRELQTDTAYAKS